MSLIDVEVVLCTYNPRWDYLVRVLDALRVQDLPAERWGLTIIDNNSSPQLSKRLNVSWHPHSQIIFEATPGLTYARIRGTNVSRSNLIVFSDDDTVFSPNFLSTVLSLMQNSRIGAAGGLNKPEFEVQPPKWFREGLAPLGCRDLGSRQLLEEWEPQCSPIGAGLVVRRDILSHWAELVLEGKERQTLGRTGQSLSSGEDNDINLVALDMGYQLAYHPALQLTHLIPERRLAARYLEKLAFASSRDWIRVLHLHNIRPWSRIAKWTVPLRQFKAWFRFQAWRSPDRRILWKGACGHFVGRSMLPSVSSAKQVKLSTRFS